MRHRSLDRGVDADSVETDMRVPDEIADEAAPDRGPNESLERTIRRLLAGQPYGVLCTQGQGQPYGSLVAYAMTPDLDSAVFSTQRATRKYRLLSECDHVALVVDNRSGLPDQLMDVEAVTATGRAHEVATGPEFEQWSRLLTDRHPYLDTFVRSDSCALFRIDIVRYFHVSRFQEVRQWVPRSRA
jgi:nitroimidazol reductase NimA-like FMN-containing flavoprotein (pyridoxamine 5'-phosphate oxidase superfamily)